jgi:hypothetical protein
LQTDFCRRAADGHTNLLAPPQLRRENFFEDSPASCRQQFGLFSRMYKTLIMLRRKFAQAAQSE